MTDERDAQGRGKVTVCDRRHSVHGRVAAASEILAVAVHLDVGQPFIDRRVARHHGRRRHRPAPDGRGRQGRLNDVIGDVAG